MNNQLITRIEPIDKKRSGIYSDEGYLFPLYASEIRKYKITVGEELTSDLLEEIVSKILFKRIRERIYYLLKDCDKTEQQIRNKLILGRYTEELISPVIALVKEEGFINDYRYACNYIESQSSMRSKRDLSNKLRQKGINGDIISQVLEELDIDETDAIYACLKKKGYKAEELDKLDYKEYSKLYSFLYSKGFSSGQISPVLKGGFEYM